MDNFVVSLYNLSKKYPFIPIIGFFIIVYVYVKSPSILYLITAISLITIFISDIQTNYILIIFLIPLLAIFNFSNPFSFSLATIIYIAVLIKYFFSTSYSFQSVIPLTLPFIIVIWELFQYLFDQDNNSFSKLVRWISLFVLANIFMLDRKIILDFFKVRTAFLYGVLISSLVGLVIMYFPFSSKNEHIFFIERFSGGAGDPNNFGYYILLSIIFYIPFKSNYPNINYILLISLVIIGSFTYSRTFFIILFIVSIFYLFYKRKLIISKLLKTALVLIIMIPIIVYFNLGNNWISGIIFRFNESDQGGRASLINSYLSGFYNADTYTMLFGKGVNGYLKYYNYELGINESFENIKIIGPHNTYVELLASYGFIGVIFIIIYFSYLIKAYKIKYRVNMIEGYKVIILIATGLFMFSLQNLSKYNFYFLVSMILLYLYESNEINLNRRISK